jgi:hypothetical protein
MDHNSWTLQFWYETCLEKKVPSLSIICCEKIHTHLKKEINSKFVIFTPQKIYGVLNKFEKKIHRGDYELIKFPGDGYTFTYPLTKLNSSQLMIPTSVFKNYFENLTEDKLLKLNYKPCFQPPKNKNYFFIRGKWDKFVRDCLSPDGSKDVERCLDCYPYLKQRGRLLRKKHKNEILKLATHEERKYQKTLQNYFDLEKRQIFVSHQYLERFVKLMNRHDHQRFLWFQITYHTPSENCKTVRNKIKIKSKSETQI